MNIKSPAQKMIIYAFTDNEMTLLLLREDFLKPLRGLQTVTQAEDLIYLGSRILREVTVCEMGPQTLPGNPSHLAGLLRRSGTRSGI